MRDDYGLVGAYDPHTLRGNPFASDKVQMYEKQVARKQKKAGIVVRQAKPFFVAKFLQLLERLTARARASLIKGQKWRSLYFVTMAAFVTIELHTFARPKGLLSEVESRLTYVLPGASGPEGDMVVFFSSSGVKHCGSRRGPCGVCGRRG